MLGLVVQAVVGVLLRRRRAPIGPRRVPSVAEEKDLERAYGRWASARGLVHDATARGYRGVVAGKSVLVRPGLDGSSAISPDVEIAIEHDEGATFLLTPDRRTDERASSDVAAALASLFDDRTLEELRSIAVIPGGLRLRFALLTGPEAVQASVDRAVGALEERLRARAGASGAYR